MSLKHANKGKGARSYTTHSCQVELFFMHGISGLPFDVAVRKESPGICVYVQRLSYANTSKIYHTTA